jgi:hypothetical protein
MTKTASAGRRLQLTPPWIRGSIEGRPRRTAVVGATALAIGLAAPSGPASAHGFAGQRFFPATLATDDPFVADELSLPTFSRRKTPAQGDEPATVESEISIDFAKRITPNFGISFEVPYQRLHPEGGETQNGFGNSAVGLKYQFYKNDEHETILSAGVDWEIGGSGSKQVGAESFSTVTPGFFFGKGFGDLPDGVEYLRPLALTGSLGVDVPTRSSTTTVSDEGDVQIERHPHVLNVGFALEYSLPYLQSVVKDVGLEAPFNRLIPVVEFSWQKPLDRGRGPSTGTVNPGLLWVGRYVQLGLEAVIPINRNTGSSVGVLAQLHFFLDDLFPRTFGRPLFGQ